MQISHAVRAPREDVEDACAFAWVQFLRYQSDRERNWQAWMFRTAQREAWRLTAIRGGERPLVGEAAERAQDGADPAKRLERRLEFQEALAELKQLPRPLQEVVLVASQVGRHRDVGEILDVPEGRVDYLLAAAGASLREAAERRTERERPVASPRAARLRELEDAPPEWLIEAVGRPPARGKNASATILAWRRAALAVDDYRHVHGWSSPGEGLGPKPSDDLVARRAHERRGLRSSASMSSARGCEARFWSDDLLRNDSFTPRRLGSWGEIAALGPVYGMTRVIRRARLDLNEQEARALHAGLQEAFAAHLIAPDHVDAARAVLDRLAAKVPSWLDRVAVRGEAGFLIAAEAVLRVLVAAEERGRASLSEVEVAGALADAKPAGVSIAEVLARMRRERLIREMPSGDSGPPWRSAAPVARHAARTAAAVPQRPSAAREPQ